MPRRCMPVRWEYKVIELKERKFSGPLRERLEDVLNQYGQERWHCIGHVSGDTAGWTGRSEGW